jgi:hypothetical protein
MVERLYFLDMHDLFLDLKDAPRVVDFLVEAGAYADFKQREAAEAMVQDYQNGKKIPTVKLAKAARKLALATWSSRTAVDHFFTHEGCEEEWSLVTAAIRPSTAHLLKRFRKGADVKTLDEVLKHEDSDSVLREEERLEIDEVRKHVRHDFWKEKGSTLALLIKDREAELNAYRERFETLRELASALAASLQDEVFSKITHYEDRILYTGEMLPLEILDQEIKYYTEQKEISPLEAS